MSRGISSKILAAAAVVVTLCVPVQAHAAVTTRSAVISRARTWVLKQVPYSQSRFATVDGTLVPSTEPTATQRLLGYRTDCSGFASMALGFKSAKGYPLSLSTATLDNVLVRIRKKDLRPGDVILRPKNLILDGKPVLYGHAVVFAYWADAAHTRYVGYHESGSNRGTIRSVIDWGVSGFYSAGGFAPYRYPGIDDCVRPPATN